MIKLANFSGRSIGLSHILCKITLTQKLVGAKTMTMMCVVDIYAAASPLPMCSLTGLPIARL